MLDGELYYASDPVLMKERQKARTLTHRLNVTEYGNELAYKQILSTLLPNAATVIWIEPPFFCDYGYNIYTATHLIDALERRKGPEFAKPISIGDDCWIGGGVIISSDITIGDRCIVGAGAVVTKDIPSDTTVVGNPAKPVVKNDA